DLLLRLEGVEVGGFAVDLPVRVDLRGVELRDVEGLADDVDHVAEHAVAHRHRQAGAGVAHRGAADETVGRLQADGPDAGVADLLGDLGHDLRGLAVDHDVEGQRGVDLGDRVRRELDVDDRTRDGDDPAVLQGGLVLSDGHVRTPNQVRRWGPEAVGTRLWRPRASVTSSAWSARRSAPPAWPWRRASAPPTISMISVVMASWRARFIMRLSFT